MKIENSKDYKVTKYTATNTISCGVLPGEDVNRLLKGYKYDEDFGMWFTEKATTGYDVTEAE